MSAIWDGDTGHITITASKASGPVDLSGATSRTVIAQHAESKESVELDVVAGESSYAAGVVVADGSVLTPGVYRLVLRVVDASVTATYPSADKGPETLTVVADLDA